MLFRSEGYEKMVYLEPFCGSGAVFFNKNPGTVETINDLDSNIVNLFPVMREQPEALKRALDLTPYSREEYDLSFLPCDEPVEKARRYVVRTTQAIGAKMRNGEKCGWRNHKQMKIGGTACKSKDGKCACDQKIFKYGFFHNSPFEILTFVRMTVIYHNMVIR